MTLRLLPTVLLLFAVLASAQTPPTDEGTPSRYRVAVLDFSVTDLTGNVSDPAGLGRAMAIAFQTPLVQSRRFTVLTRNQLDEILDELVLAEQGLLDPSEAQQMGRLAGVEVIISGSIVVNAPGTLSVTANFIDVESGEVAAALTRPTSGPQDFGTLAETLVAEAAGAFPPQGVIVQTDGEQTFINLGNETGLNTVGATGVIYRNSDIAGLTFSEQIGTFEVTQISPQASLIRVMMTEAEQTPQVGDVVTIQPLDGRVFLPSADARDADAADNSATDRNVDDTPAPASPRLVIMGIPERAQVYLDDVFVGRLNEGRFRYETAGPQRVRIEAAGYEIYTDTVEIQPNETTTLRVGLEPRPQTVAPSFDCELASRWSELRLCRYPDLAALDAAMAETYRALRERIGAERRTQLRDEQRAWLSERDRCEDDEFAGYHCLYQALNERLDVLSVRLDSVGGSAEIAALNLAAVPDELEPQGVVLLPLFSGRWDFTSARPLTNNDLANLSCNDVALMRNEILARHGFVFADPDTVTYFAAQPWYPPAGMVKDANVANQWALASLSDLEEANIRTIRALETQRCFAVF